MKLWKNCGLKSLTLDLNDLFKVLQVWFKLGSAAGIINRKVYITHTFRINIAILTFTNFPYNDEQNIRAGVSVCVAVVECSE